jgi:hypothetical protein
MPCVLCGDIPCVWLGERDNSNHMEHDHTYATKNRTRRSVAFRYLFRIINRCPEEKGIREKQPECIENGIWDLFPNGIRDLCPNVEYGTWGSRKSEK